MVSLAIIQPENKLLFLTKILKPSTAAHKAGFVCKKIQLFWTFTEYPLLDSISTFGLGRPQFFQSINNT
jgi:hypothetical protein